MSTRTAVIGTVFIDCKGFAKEAYHGASRNLGSIRFVQGGVARNVAENLAGLALATAFVSMIDASGIGNEVRHRLQAAGVDTTHLREAAEQGMGMWLAILDERGELAGSISQMPDLALLDGLLAERGDTILRECSHLVLELDLSEPIARRVLELARRHGKPVYGVPGNLDVVANYPDLLAGLAGFVCNHFEAGRLLGAELNAESPEAILALLRTFADARGLRSMVITLGSGGSVFYDAGSRDAGHQPAFPVTMVDSSGAGDAFFSGTVMGLIRGLRLRDAVVCGTKVAGWTIESPENNCRSLRERMQADAFFQEMLAKK